MSDLELAITQLESWLDNKVQVGIIFENGFSVGPTEYGTLERFEGLFVFRNPVLKIMFNPSTASAVLFQDGVYQVRLKYGSGLLSLYERKATEVAEEEGES